MDNEIVEHLIRTADKVAIREAEYKEEKLKLDLLKAEYNLNNDWEQLLGKKKPTVAEKEAFIKKGTEEQQRKVNELKFLPQLTISNLLRSCVSLPLSVPMNTPLIPAI